MLKNICKHTIVVFAFFQAGTLIAQDQAQQEMAQICASSTPGAQMLVAEIRKNVPASTCLESFTGAMTRDRLNLKLEIRNPLMMQPDAPNPTIIVDLSFLRYFTALRFFSLEVDAETLIVGYTVQFQGLDALGELNLESLVVNNLEDVDVAAITRNSHNLKSLVIECGFRACQSQNIFSSLSRHSQSLEILEVSYFNLTEAEQAALYNLRQLTSLKLSRGSGSLVINSNLSPRLQTISIQGPEVLIGNLSALSQLNALAINSSRVALAAEAQSPSITNLALLIDEYYTEVNGVSNFSAVAQFPEVRTLEVDASNSAAIFAELPALASLTKLETLKLNVAANVAVNPGDLRSLYTLAAKVDIRSASATPNYEELQKINNLSLLELSQPTSLAGIEALSNVKRLSLGRWAPESLTPLAQLRQLVSFEMADGMRARHMPVLGELVNLENLKLGSDFRDDYVASNFAFLRNLTRLKSLDLDDFTDTAMASLFAYLPQGTGIVHLACGECILQDSQVNVLQNWGGVKAAVDDVKFYVRGADAVRELAGFPNLSTIGIDDTAITDELAQIIGNHLNVKTIELYDSPISSEQIEIISAIPNLEKLTLVNCGITDEHLDKIMAFRNLKALDLSDNSGLEGRNLEQVVARLPKLEKMNLTYTGIGFFDVAFYNVATSRPDLAIWAE